MEQIQENEQWKLSGNCEKCRRNNYCSKPCTRHNRRIRAEFNGLVADTMKSEEESLLNTKSKEDEEVSNKIEIVKYIVSVKLDEKKKREDAKKNAEMRQRLLEIKAKRQDAALENMSDEELDKALAELSE